ncbi:hypothetical protein [Pseudolysinimonas yzui]|uniref:Uncharacterized protein n=1 Tax=Pseudolysinimonas yzui TaxID=2708254 RepID=A0A8J3GN20_9MICO|nr:hypothetical protein [Pseudolysinimonas yzui]GHF05595.1 hypothetical protein GCM10011600_02610 [Pseudolysinimonas yzui]
MTETIARRSRTRARIITIAALVTTAVVIGGGGLAIAAAGGPRNGILVAYGFAGIAMITMIVVFGVMTSRLSRAVRTLAERHPDAVVFLARRLPPVVSDLPAYLRSKGLEDIRLGDGWYPAFADDRGIAVCAPGADARELLVVEWAEIGDLEMVRTATVGGDSRWSVTVDVRPYAVPLTIDLGEAWGIVTMALDAGDTAAVMAAVVGRRPRTALL